MTQCIYRIDQDNSKFYLLYKFPAPMGSKSGNVGITFAYSLGNYGNIISKVSLFNVNLQNQLAENEKLGQLVVLILGCQIFLCLPSRSFPCGFNTKICLIIILISGDISCINYATLTGSVDCGPGLWSLVKKTEYNDLTGSYLLIYLKTVIVGMLDQAQSSSEVL